MTNEDELIIAHYMNWPYAEHEGIYYYDWYGRRQRNLDLNDAGLVVQEMQKRGDWDYCWDYLFDTYDELCINENLCYRSSDFTAWLFNPDNFFNAFVAWRKSK